MYIACAVMPIPSPSTWLLLVYDTRAWAIGAVSMLLYTHLDH